MALSSSKNEFTVTWKIQNYSMCVLENGEYTVSPSIFVESLDRTVWELQLYPRDGNNVSCFLARIENEDSSGSITIDCSMTLVSVDNVLNITKTRSCCTFDEQEREEFVFGNIDDIFAKRYVLLPGDIMTIRCCMWRTDCDFKEPTIPINKEMSVKCPESAGPEEKPISDQTSVVKNSLIEHVHVGKTSTLDSILSENMYLSAKKNLDDLKKHLLPNASIIRTQIACERRCKIWEIKKFNEIQINDIIFTSVVSAAASAPEFVLSLYLSKDVDGNDDVHIDIQINDCKSRYVVKCIMTILNSLYEDQSCIKEKHLFNDYKDVWHLPLIKKSKLCKDEYLKKGSLLLRCDLVISEEDNFHAIEEYVLFPNVQNTADEIDLNDRKIGLQRTRRNGEYCDVVLKSGKQEFNAHKVILSSSSSIFRDLLEDFDVQTLDIADCEPEILDKLLEYMYSGVLEEMPNEQLMKLYSAAKTYHVTALKSLCSCTLKSSLDVSNVSEVLLFADSQQDEDLKMTALKFISVFPDEVFHSLSWKKCMVNNAKIAAETMHHVLTRKFVQ